MSAKHTPGPWAPDPMFAECGSGTIDLYYQGDCRNAQIACAFGPHVGPATQEEVRANARLIAAAPDLLAALRAAEMFIVNGVDLGFIRMPDPDVPDSAHNTLPMIRAAIAQAEGEA